MSPGQVDEEIGEGIAQPEDKQLSILELNVSEESEVDGQERNGSSACP